MLRAKYPFKLASDVIDKIVYDMGSTLCDWVGFTNLEGALRVTKYDTYKPPGLHRKARFPDVTEEPKESI